MPVDDTGRRVRRAPIALLADIVVRGRVLHDRAPKSRRGVDCGRNRPDRVAVSGRHRCRLVADTAGGAGRSRSSPPGWSSGWCTVVVGMLLREATSAGVSTSFVVVASLSTAVLLLGWRAAAAVPARLS